jgi:hypothetical protein
MNIHERKTVPIKLIITKADFLSDEARKEFQKATNKIQENIQGQIKYRDSGKNIEDMAGAARAADKFDVIIQMLNKAVPKNKADELELRKTYLHIYQVLFDSWKYFLNDENIFSVESFLLLSK